MNTETNSSPGNDPSPKAIRLKIFAVGSTGLNVLERVIARGVRADGLVAVHTDQRALAASSAAEKLLLDTKPVRGLGTGGDPERGRALAEEKFDTIKGLCAGVDVVFILAGLGGGAGTGAAPVVAKAAKEAGALVVGFVTRPFECECGFRLGLARHGLDAMKGAADGVVCLPNEVVLKLVGPETTVDETFVLANDLLADGIGAFWRLLTVQGRIEIHFEDVCALVRDRHTESAFAVAEAQGEDRARRAVEGLLGNPMLEGGGALTRAASVMISILGGPDLTMAEVNRVVQMVGARCEKAQVIMGTAVCPEFQGRIAVTVIAAHPPADEPEAVTEEPANQADLSATTPTRSRGGNVLIPDATGTAGRGCRQSRGGVRNGGRPTEKRLRQGQLMLETVSKGQFEKIEPTIHKGEDLDIPTYIRRGMALN